MALLPRVLVVYNSAAHWDMAPHFKDAIISGEKKQWSFQACEALPENISVVESFRPDVLHFWTHGSSTGLQATDGNVNSAHLWMRFVGVATTVKLVVVVVCKQDESTSFAQLLHGEKPNLDIAFGCSNLDPMVADAYLAEFYKNLPKYPILLAHQEARRILAQKYPLWEAKYPGFEKSIRLWSHDDSRAIVPDRLARIGLMSQLPGTWREFVHNNAGKPRWAIEAVKRDLKYCDAILNDPMCSSAEQTKCRETMDRLHTYLVELHILPELESHYMQLSVPVFGKPRPGMDMFAEPCTIDFHAELDAGQKFKMPPAEVGEAAKQSAVFLVAPAGAGKTTLCKWIAHSWAKQVKWPSEWSCVVYVDLKSSGHILPDARSMGAWLQSYWERYEIASDAQGINSFLDHFKEKLLFVLDGVDSAVEGYIKSIALAGTVEGLPLAHVIVTGRAESLSRRTAFPKWKEIEIIGISSWVPFVGRYFGDNIEKAESLITLIKKEPMLVELAQKPLLLQLMCAVHLTDGLLKRINCVPALYDAALRMFLEQALCQNGEDVKQDAFDLSLELEGLAVSAVVNLTSRRSHPAIKAGILVHMGSNHEAGTWIMPPRSEEIWHWYDHSFRDFFFVRSVLRESLKAEDALKRSELIAERLKDAQPLAWRFACYFSRQASPSMFSTVFGAWLSVMDADQLWGGGVFREKELEGWDDVARSYLEGYTVPKVLYSFSVLLLRHGKYTEATSEYTKCYNLTQDVDIALSLKCLNDIGVLRIYMGDYIAACQELQACLEMQLDRLGRKNPVTLATKHNLGRAFSGAGVHQEALKWFQDCLTLRVEVLGKRHPRTLTTLHSVAFEHSELGHHKEAFRLLYECSAVQLEVLGSKHPIYLTTLHSIALENSYSGEHKEALQLFEECRALREEVLAPNHPDYLVTLHSIAFEHSELRKDDALDLLEACKKLQLEKMGPVHDSYLTTLHSIAREHSKRNDRAQALKLFQECYNIQKEQLGDGHPHSLRTLHSIACELSVLGRHKEALTHFEKCCEARMRVLGPDHPDCLLSAQRRDEEQEAAKR